MKQIGNDNFYSLILGIPAIILLIIFLLFFYKSIKSPVNNKLIVLTKILLGTALALSCLRYLQIDFKEVQPLRLEKIFPKTNTLLITISIFFLLFILIIKKATNKVIVSTWLVLLILNSINFLIITYEFFTWKKEPVIKSGSISEIIFSRSFEYTFSNYLMNISYPLLWIVLGIIAINRSHKGGEEKYSR